PGSPAILRLSGPLMMTSVHVLEESLREIGDVDTVIDLSDVPYMDSGGLGALLSHWTRTQHASRRFALTGTNRRLDLLLEVTKVNTMVSIFRTPEEAVRG